MWTTEQIRGMTDEQLNMAVYAVVSPEEEATIKEEIARRTPPTDREQELETALLNLLEAIRSGKCKGNPYFCDEFLAGYKALGRDILNE